MMGLRDAGGNRCGVAQLSGIVFGDTMAPIQVRLSDPFGYGISKRNIILLGSTSPKALLDYRLGHSLSHILAVAVDMRPAPKP